MRTQVWESVDELVVKTVVGVEPIMLEAMRAYVPAAAAGQASRRAVDRCPVHQQGADAPPHLQVNDQCFQLFGFDVMLDADCRPWLLEVRCSLNAHSKQIASCVPTRELVCRHEVLAPYAGESRSGAPN